MSRIIILTAAVLSAGIGAVSKKIAEDADGAAADIIVYAGDLENALSGLTKANTKIASLEDDLGKKALELQNVTEVNDQLTKEVEKLSESKAASATEPTFEHEEGTFGFHFKSMLHKGVRIFIEDVLENEHLQHELVQLGSGMLKKIFK